MKKDWSDILAQTNQVRSFMMLEVLEQPLMDFITKGDGDLIKPFYDEADFPDTSVIDISLINFIKFISTAFGSFYLEESIDILNAMNRDNVSKKAYRFRSNHPLYTAGNTDYQNVCLISGMIHMGIPFYPYYDGSHSLV